MHPTTLFIYRMTVRDGAAQWFHLRVEFAVADAPDEIVSEYTLTDWNGERHSIRADGRFVDDRFICTFREQGSDERCCVYLFPYFRSRSNKPRAGICLHETWDSRAKDCLSRAIAHDQPVLDWETDGLVDATTGASLDGMWEAEFLGSHVTLAASGHAVG